MQTSATNTLPTVWYVTNSAVQIYFEDHDADQLTRLRKQRVEVEARGIPEEYEALANKYAMLGAKANADTLRRKAAGIRQAREVSHV